MLLTITPLCEAACRENPSLIVLPEIALQWGLKGSPIDLAVPAPGPETEVFAEIAQRYRTRILLGLLERDGDAVHNSAVLIDPAGKIEGRYRKVHLAVGGEIESGILPGNTFPAVSDGTRADRLQYLYGQFGNRIVAHDWPERCRLSTPTNYGRPPSLVSRCSCI